MSDKTGGNLVCVRAAAIGAALLFTFLLGACGAGLRQDELYQDMKLGAGTAGGAGAAADAGSVLGAGAAGVNIDNTTPETVEPEADEAIGAESRDAADPEAEWQPAGAGPSAGADALDSEIIIDGVSGDAARGADGASDDNNAYKYINGETPSFHFTNDELKAMSTKNIGWGVKLNGKKQPEVPASTHNLFNKYNTAFVGDPGEPVLFLTFDLGYETGYTAPILDILKDRGVKAAFFITGHYLSSQTDIVMRMIEDGHIVANHSLKHISFPEMTIDGLIADVVGFETMFYELTGHETSKIIRPPYGEYSELSLAVSASLGYKSVLWSFAFVDYDENVSYSTDYAYKKITENYHNGAVIMLHTVNKENADVMDRIIKKALDDGFAFAPLDSL